MCNSKWNFARHLLAPQEITGLIMGAVSATQMSPLKRNDLVDRALSILASRLITRVDPGAIAALEYTPRRAEQESGSPIVGIGLTGTEEEHELAFLSRVEEARFNI